MKRAELSFEVPNVGEVLLEPITYNSGREGYMYTTKDGTFNLTLNMDEVGEEYMILKMYHEAEVICRHLLEKTDMFDTVKVVSVGLNYGTVVALNPSYYEEKEEELLD